MAETDALSSSDPGTEEYAVRLYEPGDREAFERLYDTVFGEGSEEWFDWKYVENPAVSHVPIVIAECGGDLVAARPCVPIWMTAGDERVLAIRFGDTMVHPEHRRRGLFSRTTRWCLEYYTDVEPVFGFNHPNDASLPGYRKLGGRVVGRTPVRYRVQNPVALLDGSGDLFSRGERVARPLTRAYFGARERFAPPTSGLSVRRERSIPVETLSRLYGRAPPDGVHAERGAEFYRWRFANPQWRYTAYVAERGDEPLSAVVTGERSVGGVDLVTLVEVVPLAENHARVDAVSALFSRIVADHADADLLAYSGRAVPGVVLSRYGFHADDVAPLSFVARPTELVVYDLTGGRAPSWSVGGYGLLDPGSWALSFCERDAR
ncbi:GNAT family N-acetyltransferase [Natronorarus salvus]|uniref:GNAT family N-acetyltransferase n=1 Tax=Natronorarus salvus TaxID=3117733 RepID=UPI002F263CFE